MTKVWNSFSILIVLAMVVLLAPAVLPGPLPDIAFAQGNYTLTMAVSGNGTTTPSVGDHSYAPGTNVTINATPGAGYGLVNWSLSNFTVIARQMTYNYEGVSRAIGPHRAYYCDVDGMPPTGGNLNSKTEATDAEYILIAVSDNTRWTTPNPGASDEVFLWQNISIGEDPANITNIDLTFEGYSSTTGNHQIWAYNYNTATWGQIGTSLSITTGVDTVMTRSITSGFSNYITGAGLLTWGVYGPPGGAFGGYTMSIDYVETVVDYTVVSKDSWVTTDNPSYVIMNANTTATANFESVALTMAVNGNGTTTPAIGAHSYGPGTVVGINATADPGWQFANWTGPCWQYRKAITINHSKVAANLTDFPVVISLTDTDLRDKAQSDGGDIMFTSSDGATRLAHEIEKYNGSTGELVAHVGVPALSASADTVIYMYYGNAAVSKLENAAGVWDEHYMMVQHLEETSGTHHDSTPKGNDGTPYGGINQSAVGRINGADSFDGTSGYVKVPNSLSLDITGPITITAIINLTNVTADQKILARQIVSDGYKLGAYTNSKMEFEIRHGGTVTLNRAEPGGTTLTTGTTYFVGGWWNSTVLQSIVNGQFERPISLAESPSFITTNAYIGAEYNLNEAWFWHGMIDELRVSDIARSAGWLSTSYNTQMFPSTFYGVGSETGGVYFSAVSDLNSSSTNVTVDYNMTVTANFIPAPPEESNITGTVYEANASVVGGADVVLLCSGSPVDNTTTNASGYYNFTVNATCNYRVNVTKAGITYAEKWANVTVLGDDVTCDFKGMDAPYRTAPNGLYVIKCSNLWLWGGAHGEFALDATRVSDVLYAWTHPS
jgi:hypothetical protein